MGSINRREVIGAVGLGATAVLSGLGGSTVAMAQQKIVLRLSHAIGKDTPRQHAAESFAKRMDELTKGQVKVEIYPDAQLGSEAKTLEGLQTGTIDLGVIAIYANVVTAAKVFELPFLFRDYAHWNAALNGEAGRKASDAAKGTGLRVIGYWFGGWRDMYGNRQIRTMKDLAGLKIRTQQTPAYVELFKAAGAIPTPIAWTETYMALQQRTVDAAETNFSSMYDQKQYEVTKFGTVTNHAAVTTAFLVSDAKWNSLPQNVRDAILVAEKEARKVHQDEVLATDPKVIEKLKKLGLTFIEFDTTELRKIARQKVFPSVVVEDIQKQLLAAVEAL